MLTESKRQESESERRKESGGALTVQSVIELKAKLQTLSLEGERAK